MQPAARPGAQRRADAVARLQATAEDVWVATAAATGAVHLVPLSFAWIAGVVVLAAERSSPTVRNLQGTGRARLGFGPTRDVVIVDATLDDVVDVGAAPPDVAVRYAAQSDWDPREESGGYVFVMLRPVRIQAWREANELAGRTLMRDGEWVV